MDFKLFKLNLKIAWMKATGKLNKINKNIQFSSVSIESPNILIIFPVNKDLISKSIESISSILNSQKNNNLNFSFITNNKIENNMNFYNIDILSFIILKSGKIDNLDEITDRIYFKNFDIVIDLNVNFRLDIALMVNDLNSKYKIGFISKYSDLFYNIQLKKNKNNIYGAIKDIIG